MTQKNTIFFEPLKIGNVEIKNRVAMAPMGISGLLNPNGSPGQRAIDYYRGRMEQLFQGRVYRSRAERCPRPGGAKSGGKKSNLSRIPLLP
jgi:hypothetical protein